MAQALSIYQAGWGPAVAQGFPADVRAPWQQEGTPRPAPATQLHGAPPGVQKWNGVVGLNPDIMSATGSWLVSQMHSAPPGVQKATQPIGQLSQNQIRQMHQEVVLAQVHQSGASAVSWASALPRRSLSTYG